MFHVTPFCNVPSILQHGIVPQVGERSADLGEPCPRVYVFPTLRDCDTALGQWLGDWFTEREEATGEEIPLAIVEIEPAGLPTGAMSREVEWEVAIESRVPPEAIVRLWSEEQMGRAVHAVLAG